MLLWGGPQIQAMLRSELTDRPSLSRPIASVRQEHQRRSAASPNRSFKAPRCTGRQAEVGNAGQSGPNHSTASSAQHLQVREEWKLDERRTNREQELENDLEQERQLTRDQGHDHEL